MSYVLHFAKIQRTRRGFEGYEVNVDKSGPKVKIPVSFKTREFISIVIPDDESISLCDGGIDIDVIENVEDELFFLMYYKNSYERICTAVVIAVEYSNVFYLNLVCSTKRTSKFNRHSATYLIDRAVEHAKSRGLREMSLSSVPSALTYYPKLGFSHRKSCNLPVNVELPQEMVHRAARGNVPKNTNAARNKDWGKYMNLLRERGYGNDVSGYTMKRCI